MRSLPPTGVRVNRPLDLASVHAVGFDLDHTLALYDDAAVNEIASAAARRLLVEQLGYPGRLLEGVPPMEAPAAARALAADLAHGAVVKLDDERCALRARLGGRWLGADELRARYPGAIADRTGSAYTVHSPFELPVLWLLEEMESTHPTSADRRAARCEDIRRMLDAAHTNGVLKRRLREDLERFVRGIDGIVPGLERWACAGKQLFIVTNSEPDFAPAVLDRAVGPSWRRLFRLVVTSARKPAFFAAPAAGLVPRSAPHVGAAVMVEGGSAAGVEAMLGVRPERILFVGDNARSDIHAARSRGWRTAHVVPELAGPGDNSGDAWGDPLHDGRPTWLARQARVQADVVCAHAGRLAGIEPAAALSLADAPAPGRETA